MGYVQELSYLNCPNIKLASISLGVKDDSLSLPLGRCPDVWMFVMFFSLPHLLSPALSQFLNSL